MNPREELFQLLNLQVEDRLNVDQNTRLNELLRSNPQLVDDYVDYSVIHAQLHWDAGLSVSRSTELVEPGASVSRSSAPPASKQPSARRLTATLAAAAAIVLCAVVVSQLQQPGGPANFVLYPGAATDPDAEGNGESEDTLAPVAPLEMRNQLPTERQPGPTVIAETRPQQVEYLPAQFTNEDVTGRLDDFLATTWDDQGIQPSPTASDYEWLRRVYLTYTGRIPTLQESERFLTDRSPRKYDALIAKMCDDSERSSYLAVVWTNLLIGRTEKRCFNREKLY